MEFWLNKDGEKDGPILDFELRSRIRAGEVKKEQKIWYSDLDEWTPIGEVEIFANEFAPEVVTEENVEEYLGKLEREEPKAVTPPPVPVELHLWRRFGGRWFDYLVYLMTFFLLVLGLDLDLLALWENPYFAFVFILPWLFLETVALHYWGTTPGKWLVGLQVRGPDGNRLTPGSSFLRTMRVMILGMGFGQIFLREICHLVALWFAVKKRIVMWDTAAGIRLVRTPESAVKWIVFGLGLFLALLINAGSMFTLSYENMSSEEREKFHQDLDRAMAPLQEVQSR
ncbi:RDD family protein [Roseibacillus persicicus]|uniref:RDD family protein n=1 Tax=Roseibacillus persicicus TaxID=454148 RepID=UPI00281024E0|nr:RDD family protein [Roseibacillus persicicus]MDQ8191310.1 RDD family protein [Roseibacillus persicicus]